MRPDQIGAYQVRGLLGAGGMGEVYLAHDDRLGRNVAIKILPHVFACDADRLARFERGARALAALNHPNIATIHGVEQAGDTRAIVLELVEGPTLAEVIARHSRSGMPIPEVVAVARQIAEALEAAHDKGIIHRDLKPANIKVTESGPQWRSDGRELYSVDTNGRLMAVSIEAATTLKWAPRSRSCRRSTEQERMPATRFRATVSGF